MTEKKQQIASAGFELVQSLHDNPDVLPPYNKKLVDKCAKQIIDLYNENVRSFMDLKSKTDGSNKENEDQVFQLVRIRQVAIDQIKRCTCAYINERMKRIKNMRWKCGGQIPEKVKNNMSEHEHKWLKNYNEITFEFQNEFGKEDEENEGEEINGGDGVNLFNYVDPPDKLIVKVRALKDSGQFETSDGITVVLAKGAVHLLPRQDCENLVRKGVLEYVNQITD
ncbi:unnamed protein product [Meloidogyne enterolobii]|uniref:Uncharacterized protein n=1 Tax=Meloidogyne enterolobii TaxID=390850 RepID=A0ACB0Y3H1_MELEN